MTRCAVAALQRADPLPGTAPPAERWLLLEHPGPWPVDAVAGSGIEPGLLAALTGAAQASRTRILLVRRPGRRRPEGARRWLLVRPGAVTVDGRWHQPDLGTTSGDAGLQVALAALTADRPVHPVDPVGPVGPVEPVILVCAHGVHDTCCAVQGRPVAAALAERWPRQVWECSHVGGDRFAPNVVLLPDGFYYGGLDPAAAVAAVEQHLTGRVATTHLRGMARFPPAQQAAAVAVFARFGPLPADAVSVIGARHEGHYGAPDSRTHVELAVHGRPGSVHAEVVARSRPPAQLTCRALKETTATEYRVERLG